MEIDAYLIYDGECRFCIKSIEILKKFLDEKISVLSYQSLFSKGKDFLLNENIDFYQGSIKFILDFKLDPKLIETMELKERNIDKRIYFGAEAIFKVLKYSGKFIFLNDLYEKNFFFKKISDQIYSFIAKNRKCLNP